MNFTARMRLTFDTTVEIEADSREEARKLLAAGEWKDHGLATAELVDWSGENSVKEEKQE